MTKCDQRKVLFGFAHDAVQRYVATQELAHYNTGEVLTALASQIAYVAQVANIDPKSVLMPAIQASEVAND